MNTEMTVFKSEAEQFRSSLLRSELSAHEERQAAQQLTSRNAALTTQALHYQTALKHNELQTAQLRTSFDENRTTLLEYLGERFEEKLQWEENESHYRLSVEKQPHDDLVSDLMDQNAELQAEVDSLRMEVAESRVCPTQLEPHLDQVLVIFRLVSPTTLAHRKVVPIIVLLRFRVHRVQQHLGCPRSPTLA